MFLADTYTCPILGPLIPLLWITGDVSSGFKCQSEFLPYSIFAETNVMSRSTSGAIPVDLLMASITAGHFLTCINQVGVDSGSYAQKTQYDTSVAVTWLLGSNDL